MGFLRRGRRGISTPSGRSQINVPGLTQTAYPFMNFIKNMAAAQTFTPSFAFPGVLDTNGYPNSGSVTAAISSTLQLPSSYGTGVWRYGWTGTGQRQLVSTGGITVTANSGATINGVAGFTGATGNVNISITGTNPAISFYFTSGVPSTVITCNWSSGATFSGMAAEYLVRDSDWSAFQAGGTGSYFTPEFVAFYAALNPKQIRFMDWAGANNNIISRYAFQPTVNSNSFAATRWEPTCWGGTTTNSGDAFTAGSTPSGWPGFVNGATIHLQFNATTTTTTPTLTVNGTTKTIINFRGTVPAIGIITANQLATCVYDAVLDKFLYIISGFYSSSGNAVPIEYQAALCNLVNCHMWNNFPVLYDVASVQSLTSAAKAALNSNLNFMLEPVNEVWNNNNQTNYLRVFGSALGFSSSGNRDYIGAYALKTAQMLSAASSTWGGGGRFVGVLGVQAYSGQAASIGGTNDLYRLLGTDLNGTTFPNYAAAGFSNYDTAPNRPVDQCQVLTYATYWAGAQCVDFDVNYVNPLNIGGPNGGPNTGLLGAADDWASGVPAQQANALAFMDWDARGGNQATISVTSISSSGTAVVTTAASHFLLVDNIIVLNTTGTFDPAIVAGQNYYVTSVPTATTFQFSATQGGTPISVSGASTGTIKYGKSGQQGDTLLNMASGQTGLGAVRGVYPAWDALAANYSLRVECYEGGPNWIAPTTARCTALGISTSYGTTANVGGKIYDLIVAYKQSSLFQQAVLDQYSQFMTQSKSVTPSQYGVIANPANNAQWALRVSDLFGADFKSYDAIRIYNS